MKNEKTFTSYDGTLLGGTFSPGNDPTDDVILFVHGITSSRDELGLFSGFADHLAENNVSSFRFDYRCHGVNKQPMQQLTLSGIVNDIEAAAIKALQLSEGRRIHIIGMSFGGGLSAFWAANTKQTVVSVVMCAPVIDYEEDILGQFGLLTDKTLDKSAQRHLTEKGFLETGGIRYGRALLNEVRYISGVKGLQDLDCESLIVHGDADSIVPYSSSQRFVKLNERCRLVNIPGTDHGFGVANDEDLTSPETKAKHLEVFRIVSEFIERTSKQK